MRKQASAPSPYYWERDFSYRRKPLRTRFAPLPAGAVRLTNFLENDIRNSIEHWNKGELPYREFVEFFRSQAAPQFALGEMWAKRCARAACFTDTPRTRNSKSILKATVEDLLSVQNPNGSISCTPEEQQPGGENGDLWERKYVMLGLDEYYRWVEQNPAVLEALKKHADCLIAQIGHAPKTEIVDLGWSATNIGHEACHIESSTLLEPLHAAVQLGPASNGTWTSPRTSSNRAEPSISI